MRPMKLAPVFKDYIWGGTRLPIEYAKNTDMRPVAESWEVSVHPAGPSRIVGGEYAGQTLRRVLEEHPEMIREGQTDFPVLIKLIDAKESLSLQVHPKDDYAKQHENQQGKNEMWYVLHADPGATLLMGFQEGTTQQELEEKIDTDEILALCEQVPVKRGDCFAIPAGMIHSIGGGVVIAEVQQNSDVTYRVYDYGRKGKDGLPRPLAIEKALDVLDVTLRPENAGNNPSLSAPGCTITPLVNWEYFYTEKIDLRTLSQHYVTEKSFHAIVVLAEDVVLRSPNSILFLSKGESVFLPAGMGEYKLEGPGSVLVVKLAYEEPLE